MLNPDFRDMCPHSSRRTLSSLVVGAYALAAHGIPRATGDLDFWIRPTAGNAERVLKALVAFGAPTSDIATGDLATSDIVFQIGVGPNRIEILTSIDGVEFDDAWAEQVTARAEGLSVPILSIRHMIRNRRAVGRPQDLADVAALESRTRRGPVTRRSGCWSWR